MNEIAECPDCGRIELFRMRCPKCGGASWSIVGGIRRFLWLRRLRVVTQQTTNRERKRRSG